MRKSPIRHTVRKHTRKSRPVRSYTRGKGKHNPTHRRNPLTTKRRIEKVKPFDFWGTKKETKPFDYWTTEKSQEEVNKEILQEKAEDEKAEQVKPDIPYYSRDDLEKMFLGDDEETARKTAESLGFEFERQEIKGDVGEKILEFRYPIDTDVEPGIQEPDAYREVDLTIDLSTEKVSEVFSFMSNAPKDRWSKTEEEY